MSEVERPKDGLISKIKTVHKWNKKKRWSIMRKVKKFKNYMLAHNYLYKKYGRIGVYIAFKNQNHKMHDNGACSVDIGTVELVYQDVMKLGVKS